jgi:hypothetical protein
MWYIWLWSAAVDNYKTVFAFTQGLLLVLQNAFFIHWRPFLRWRFAADPLHTLHRVNLHLIYSQARLKFIVFSREAPGRVSDTLKLAAKFDHALRCTMDCAALRSLLEVALVFGNTLNKVAWFF